MLEVESRLTGLKQNMEASDLDIIDPRRTKFRVLKEDVTPPEAKTVSKKAAVEETIAEPKK